jgi:hypothetical protein
MNKIGLYSLVVLILLITWVGCNRVIGTYVANHGFGTDTLKILSNHKYIRICYPPNNSSHYRDTGTWDIEDGTITFRGWHGRNELNGSFDGDAIWGADLDRSFYIGNLRLPINLDMGYYYIKQ